DSTITPSSALVPKNPMKVAGAWKPNQTKIVTATYTVPTVMASGNARREAFYGYAVRVFYAGVLQDQSFRPSKLKDYVSR
ncbi:MAG: hypothetical protein WCL44_14390, partial [bacterium]